MVFHHKNGFEGCSRGSHQGIFCWKGFLKNFTQFTGKHLCHSHFFIKVVVGAPNLIKKGTLAQAFSGELCEILKSTYFEEHLRSAACSVRVSCTLLSKMEIVNIVNLRKTSKKMHLVEFFLSIVCNSFFWPTTRSFFNGVEFLKSLWKVKLYL